MIAFARRQRNYFQYGTTTPSGTLYAKLSNGAQWILDQLSLGAASGKKAAQEAADATKESATAAKHRAEEQAQKAGDKIKEEL